MARISSPEIAADAPAPPGGRRRSLAFNLLLSLRPGQWTKNLLVFAGLLFGQRLFDRVAFGKATTAFAVFCALSGVVYLINDVLDRESDRQHPLKSARPIASGAVSVPLAVRVALLTGLVPNTPAIQLGR